MLRLALRTLRLRKGGFLATFVAAFLGAVIVSACGGLMETGIRADAPPQRLAAAPIVVSGQQEFELSKRGPSEDDDDTETAALPERVHLDPALAEKIRATPGVSTVVSDVTVPVVMDGGRVAGHAWDSAVLAPYTLTAGHAPRDGEVVVAAVGAKPGDTVQLAARGTTGSYRVAGVAAARTTAEPTVFFTAAEAARLAGHEVDAFGVFTTADPNTVAAQLNLGDGVVARTGDDRGYAEFPQASNEGTNLVVLSAVSGGLSVLVALFVIATTLGLATQQRRRELALLRAIGTTPRQLRRMVLGEAVVIGLLAIGAAAALGPLLGKWLFGRLTEADVVPDVVRFHQGWLPMTVAAGAALLAVVIAASVAARRVSRIRPTEALAEATVERRWLTPLRLVVAALCFGGGAALSIVTVAVMTGPVAASTAGPAVMLWAIGVAAIGPGVTKLVAVLLHGPVRLVSGVTGWLALANTRTAATRVSGAVTPIMLAVGIATANIYLQTTQQAVSQQAFTEDLRADAVVAAPAGVSPDLLRRVRQTPGVAAASEYVTSTVFVTEPYDESQNDDGHPALGLTTGGAASATSATVSAGSLDALTGQTIALPDTVASELHRGVGDSITLRLGDGQETTVRVVALLSQRPGFETMLFPTPLLASHTTAGLASQVLVRAEPGVDQARLTASLTAATAGQPVSVGDRASLLAGHASEDEVGAWVNYLMIAMIIGYTVISVVNTLVMATARRRREFGLQRLGGFTRTQVLRMAGVEGGLVAAIGVVLGTVVSAGSIVPFCLVATGSPLPIGPIGVYAAVVAIAGVLALFASLVPAWAATRARPVTAVSLGE
ncbi:ABC transporter permease [Amycolatopsis jiangsuensis]|uniref:Putative ABC transport system permease protein n=1 Tax=Amycolatopsis jiangsuensis TaxID=1181879 RepID=A0A840J1B0_9PSEU|nr:ABC transporter permease [Amycolatopsis jiangsuensis]MBB4687435.1 putative ABC transport system permease protein [Amycolatopsis jiangsuensis]